jgi:hypothetical protein
MCDLEDAFRGDLITGPAFKRCACPKCGRSTVSRRTINGHENLSGIVETADTRAIQCRFRITTKQGVIQSLIEKFNGRTDPYGRNIWDPYLQKSFQVHPRFECAKRAFQQEADVIYLEIQKLRNKL